MTTKKTFEAVAAAFKAAQLDPELTQYSPEYHKGFKEAYDSLALEIAETFAADNPRFDRARFYRACGLEGVK